MKKKIIALILCFAMVLTFMPLAAFAGDEETQKENEQIVEVQPQQEVPEVNEGEKGSIEENLEEPEENEEEMLLGLGAPYSEDFEAYVDFRDDTGEIVETIGYATLEEAIEACEIKPIHDTVRLNKDIERDGSTTHIELKKGIELNGQGHTIEITGNDGYLFDILLVTNSMGSLELENVIITSDSGFINECQGMVVFNEPEEDETAVSVDVEGTFIEHLGNVDDSEKNKFAQFFMKAGNLEASTVVASSDQESMIVASQGTITGDNLFMNIHGQAHFYNEKEGTTLNIIANEKFIELCDNSVSNMKCDIECLGESAQDAIVMHGGSFNPSGVSIHAKNNCLVADGGKVSIYDESTQFISDSDSAIKNESAEIIIGDGTFKGHDEAIELIGGTLNIEKGNFSNNNKIILQNGGYLRIIGGQFTDSQKGIEITNGKLVITDGNFKTVEQALDVQGGEVNIYGGKLESLGLKKKTTSTISNTKGELHIYTGIFVANRKNNCISVSDIDGKTTIDNGTFTANGDCVVVKNEATLNINDGKYVSKNANAIDIEKRSTANVSTAVFETQSSKKKVYAIKGSLTIAEESQVIPKKYRYAKKVEIKKAVAAIGEQTYPSIDSAIAAASEGDTIKLLCDIEAYYINPIEVNKEVTIDFDEHKIKTGKSMFDISRNGNLTLLDAQIETVDLSEQRYGFFKNVEGNLTLIDNNTYAESHFSMFIASDFIETVGGNATVEIDGGAIYSDNTIVCQTEPNSKITVKNAVLKAESGFDQIAGELNVDNVSIDANAYGITIDEGGNLDIRNSKVSSENNTAIRTEGADAYIENVEAESAGVTLQLCGNATINGGKYTSSAGVVVDCININEESEIETNIVIEDGEFVSSKTTCVRGDYASVTIKDGTYKSLGTPEDKEIPLILTLFGELEIQDGLFEGNDIGILAGNSDVKILGGEFNTVAGTIELDGIEGEEVTTKVEISGGDFSSQEANIIFIACGTAIINGGNFITESNKYPIFNFDGNLVINDAYIESKAACVYTQSTGENTINGGIFKATDEAALKFWNDSTVTLSGGKFETKAKTAAIKDIGTLKFAKGFKADPDDWKEKQSQVIEVVEMTGEVIEGQKSKWSEGSTEGLRFRIDAPYEDFISVYVDGKFVDKANYTSWEGSTYVELKPEFLKTLSKGNHDIEFNFLGGVTAKTTFSIGDPKTADPNSMILWLILLVMAAALAGVVIFKFRQPKKAVASGRVIKVVYTSKVNK